MMTLFLIVVLICLLLAATAEAGPGGICSLKTGKLTAGFDTDGDNISLVELSGTDGRNWIAKPGDGPLWRIAFSGPDGAVEVIDSNQAEPIGIAHAANGLQFAWEICVGTEDREVELTIEARKGSVTSEWSLKVESPPGWKVTRADFPILPDISPEVAKKMAVPFGYGLEYDVKPGMGYEATYPSMIAAMQFVTFYGTGKALYIGTHDSEANHKVYNAKADEHRASFTCANWPGLAEGDYEAPGKAVIGVVDGGWYEAAQVYRKWALTAPWSKAGPVSQRPIPQWLKDTDLWLRVEFGYEGIADVCKRAREYFGDVATALHWYKWHEIPYDTLYPDYFPTRPGFAEGVKELQEQGFHVMPYINGRIVDPNSKGWNEEGLSKSAARRENGEPYTEVYGSKVPLNSMCPSSTAWHDKVAYLVDRLTHECNVDGVYVDQIGCAWAYPCYDKAHDHLPGGGHFWVDGYRELLDKARAKLPAGRMFTTEENIECFIDKFDALLLVNTPCATDRAVIPLFPAVYSGRTITFGFQYIAKDDIGKSTPFRAKMAREFIYGAQIGWVLAEQLMAPEAEKEREFVRNLTKCRSHAHKFLLEARFLGLVDVTGDNPSIKFTADAPFGGDYTLDLPSVFASAWEAEDGSIGVALANMSDEDRRVEFVAPLKKSKAYQMEEFGPEGRISTAKAKSAMQTVTVPARSAVVVAFSIGVKQ